MKKKFKNNDNCNAGKGNGDKYEKKPNGRSYNNRNNHRNPRNSNNAANLSSLNDISWYSKNPELLEAAARIPFATYPGDDLRMPMLKSGQNIQRVPGVMGIRFVYSVGYSNDVTSPASITAKELFARIRSKFSGALDEDAPDLFMYCIALDQIHAYIAWLKRIYRTINIYSPKNRYWAETVLGMEFGKTLSSKTKAITEHLQRNKMTLWSYINTLVNMANKFAVPNNMDVYTRHRWMNENIYLDAPSFNSQVYVFYPHAFGRVDDTTETGTSIVFDAIPNGEDVDSLYEYGKNMISALSDWDDAYTISGHIMRAFEGVEFYTSPLLGQDEILDPVYVPEVLEQIHNMRIVPLKDRLPGITQNPNDNAIIHKPQAFFTNTTNAFTNTDATVNLDVTTTDSATVTIASRLAPVWDDTGMVHCGTEIPVELNVSTLRGGETDDPMDGKMAFSFDTTAVMLTQFADDTARLVATQLSTVLKRFAVIMSWYKAPMFYFCLSHTASQGDTTYDSVFMATADNLTAISTYDMINLHRVCVYSEFNCFNK